MPKVKYTNYCMNCGDSTDQIEEQPNEWRCLECGELGI